MDGSREQKHKACDSCKRRKVRCTGRQPCQNCLRAKEQCIFTSPYGRLANAERRAERAVERCRLLEAAWAQYVPHVPIETVIESLRQQRSPSAHNTDPPYTSPDQGNLSDTARADASSLHEDPPQPAFQESEEAAATSLEWDESSNLSAPMDGTGSLTVHAHGAGYMGPQSGRALLMSLQPLYGSLLSSDEQENRQGNHDVLLEDQVLKAAAFSSRCVDAYFKFYHHAYPILHEGHFRAQWMGVLRKPQDGSWPILYNVVLAIGAHSGDFSRQNADKYFYEQARQHLSWDVLQRGSLPLVQALVLMANYLQKRDRPNSGFTLLGAAINMAQGIGLHREFSEVSMGIQAMEIRRRVWWILFIFDAGARLTFGRPSVAPDGVNVARPCNIDDGDLPADVAELPAEKDYTTVSSCLIHQISLAKISNRANEQLLQFRNGTSDMLLSLGREVQQWRDQLPAYMKEISTAPIEDIFQVPRMVLLWRSMHLRMVIYRPFVLQAIKQRTPLALEDPHSPHAQCIEAATECLTTVTTFWAFTHSHHGFLTWYACYWLVNAVITLIMCLVYAPQHELANQWRHNIDLARSTIESMSNYEVAAVRAVRVIDQLIGLVPSSDASPMVDMGDYLQMGVAHFWNGEWTDLGDNQNNIATDAYSAP